MQLLQKEYRRIDALQASHNLVTQFQSYFDEASLLFIVLVG
jgi:hypothetical protein